MGCGVAIVKFVLFVFNLICALCGIALIVAGIACSMKYNEILDVLKENNISIAPILFIVSGAVIFLIAFFGCCGAIYESECMISTYAVLLFLMLISQIVLGVLILTNKNGVKNVTKNALQNLWKDNHRTMQFWNTAQRTFECCGLDGPTNWGLSPPKSCCRENVDECVPTINAFNKGCQEAITDFITEGSVIYGSVSLSVAAIELIGFIFACILGNHIRNYKRRYM